MWRGTRLRVEIGRDKATYTVTTGEPLEFEHWGDGLELSLGDTVDRPIPPAPTFEPPSQPPGREPTMRERNRALRREKR